MSFESITVKLHGQVAGYLLADQERISFEYDDNFINLGLEISPRHLPLKQGVFTFPALLRKPTFKGLPGVFADSLPDNYGSTVMNEYFKKKGLQPEEVPLFARLLYIGTRGMGALEYEPEEKIDIKGGEEFEVTELWAKSRRVLEGKIEDDTDGIFRYGGSAGGARAKAIILFNPDTREFRTPGKNYDQSSESDDGFSNWLIKFDGVVPENPKLDAPMAWERIEYIYNLMAKNADLQLPEFDYVEENNRFHFLVKRFDREGSKKVHMHTLGGLLHESHHDQRSVSYEVFLRTVQDLTEDGEAVREAFRRMVFNVLAQNLDDHVKNFSFLMDDDGKWHLSPTYDLVFCSLKHAIFARGHQMTICGKPLHITRNDLEEIGRKYSVSSPGRIIKEVYSALTEFDSLSREFGVKERFPDYHDRVKESIESVRRDFDSDKRKK